MLIFVTILLYHIIGYIELIRKSVLVIKHPSICIRCIMPKFNVTMFLTLQMVETVKKHVIIIQQESARRYMTIITQHFIAKHILYDFSNPITEK